MESEDNHCLAFEIEAEHNNDGVAAFPVGFMTCLERKRQPTIVQISNVLFFKMTLMEHTKKEGRIDSMKKMISILLSVALFLSVFPVSIFAAGSTNENTESGYTYTVENGEATITGCDDSITGDVVLPDTLGGYPVTQIGREAFRYNRYLTSIRIPDSVTSIGESAFLIVV